MTERTGLGGAIIAYAACARGLSVPISPFRRQTTRNAYSAKPLLTFRRGSV